MFANYRLRTILQSQLPGRKGNSYFLEAEAVLLWDHTYSDFHCSIAFHALTSSNPYYRWLFQTRRAIKFSTRRVQQIVKLYAEEAGVRATLHTFRY